MAWLILGAGGQTGLACQKLAVREGIDVLALSHRDLDLCDGDALGKALDREPIDLVINTAGYTAVDQAESETVLAYAVNAEAPGRLAALCHERNLPLVHFSTDYVFDGQKAEPYREDDAVNPLSVYGASKAAGEAAVRAAASRHIILRTSWVFGAGGRNFVTTMLRLAEERQELRVVDDQEGGPTSTACLANAVLAIAGRLASGDEMPWGTYHLSGAPSVTWYGFAKAVFQDWAELAGVAGPRLVPITTAEFPTAARRPANSALDCRRIGEAFAIEPGNWRRDLRKMLEDIKRESCS